MIIIKKFQNLKTFIYLFPISLILVFYHFHMYKPFINNNTTLKQISALQFKYFPRPKVDLKLKYLGSQTVLTLFSCVIHKEL